MNSANKIDYETRPCKYAERRMLIASLSRIIGAENKTYQYIGFGGLSFVDYKLFHREGTEKVPFFYDQNGKCLRFVTSLSANRLK